MNNRTFFSIIAILAIFISVSQTSCSGSLPWGKNLAKTQCKKDSEMSGTFRAHASAESERESFAKDKAITLARNELAGNIATGISSTINIFNSEVSGDGLTTLEQQDILGFVSEIVKGSRVMCTETYYRKKPKDKGALIYTVEVCVEISEASISQLYNQVQSRNYLKVQKTQSDFLNRTREEFERYRDDRGIDRDATGF